MIIIFGFITRGSFKNGNGQVPKVSLHTSIIRFVDFKELWLCCCPNQYLKRWQRHLLLNERKEVPFAVGNTKGGNL